MAFPTSVTDFPTIDCNTTTTPADIVNAVQVDLEAVETKLGTGASTSTNNTILKGTGAGTSAWSDTITGLEIINAELTTPQINEAVATTATSTELNYNDGVNPGTAVASKTVVLNATNDFNFGTGDITATIGTFTSINSNFPQGFLVNGQISRTVVSNDLIVAIKTLAGTDPSATDPVYVRIGNNVRAITAALSITLADGTNYFGSGASELATLEVDYFVYLVWVTGSSTVALGFARVPHGRTYADFSGTNTNVLYLATSTTPASGDEVELVGRFNATLSATAAFTWSVPATSVIINRPVFETRNLTWTPTLVGFSANPTNVIYQYRIVGNTVGALIGQSTAGTSNAVTFTVSMPMRALTLANYLIAFPCSGVDNGSGLATPARVTVSTGATVFDFATTWAGAGWTAANGKRAFTPELFYRFA